MDYCNCKEQLIILDDAHLFEMCYKCNKLRKMNEFEYWLRDRVIKLVEELKDEK